ncbi:MAG: DUF3093 domain-containing protein [Actinomycetia bacterium]|nr:DUF3093 domain-containing protein [Actinomycetes bacterium]
MPTPDVVSFRERLTAPWWFWTVIFFWAMTLAIAYGSAIATPVGIIVGTAAFTLASLGVARVATLVTVSAAGLNVGHAHLPLDAIGKVEVLDASAARRRRGTGADSRAFVLLRGWVPTAVAVAVVDPRDPTPYWYVSSRSPEQLAAALGVTRHGTSDAHSVTDMTGSGSAPSAPSAVSAEEGT